MNILKLTVVLVTSFGYFSISQATEIKMNIGQISISECTLGTQGIQETPYAEFKIQFPVVDVLLEDEISSFKEYSHNLFIGPKLDYIGIAEHERIKSVRFYQDNKSTALENCQKTRNKFEPYDSFEQ